MPFGLNSFYKAALLGLTSILLAGAAQAAPIWVNWTIANSQPGQDTAIGDLNGISVEIQADTVAGVGDGGVLSLVDGSDPVFANSSVYSPSIAVTDRLNLASASNFTITFGAPVSGIVLHIYELESSTLSFTDGQNPLTFTLLSSDNGFNIPTGSTASSIRGVTGIFGDSGSLYFAGTITQLSWTVTTPDGDDGFSIQLSTIPEPSSMTLAGLALAVAGISRRRRA